MEHGWTDTGRRDKAGDTNIPRLQAKATEDMAHIQATSGVGLFRLLSSCKGGRSDGWESSGSAEAQVPILCTFFHIIKRVLDSCCVDFHLSSAYLFYRNVEQFRIESRVGSVAF